MAIGEQQVGQAHSHIDRDADWAHLILGLALRSDPRLFPDQISGIALVHEIETVSVRRFVQLYGAQYGLDGLNRFARDAVMFPHDIAPLIERLTNAEAETAAARERLELAAQALGLSLIRTYRLGSFFQSLLREFFYLGEPQLHLVAEMLAHIVGVDSAVTRLYRCLSTPDADLREYVLYVLAEFAETPAFAQYESKLAGLYGNEKDAHVREAYECLFNFDRSPNFS